MVLEAVKKCPGRVNLRVITDNQATIAAIRTGQTENSQVQEIVNAIKALASRKNINLVLKWISTGKNLADFPSRNLVEGSMDECFASPIVPISSEEIS